MHNFGNDCRNTRQYIRLITWIVLAMVWLAGCGTKNPHPRDSYEYGVFWAENGKHLQAVNALESFVRRNPTDSLAVHAQFKKAETYIEMKEYPVAAVELKILRQDFPTSPLVEDAYFLEGEAYLKEVGRIERDVTGAYKARLHFLDFSQRYPQSSYMPRVREYMEHIADLLVEKKLRNAHVFEQKGQHQAVAVTLDTILDTEPTSSLIDRVLLMRGKVAEKLDDNETATNMFQRLLTEYPHSEYAEQAQQHLATITGENNNAAQP